MRYINFILLLIYIIPKTYHHDIHKCLKIYSNNHSSDNKNNDNYFECLFDSIKYDNYNLSLIYDNTYKSIKIKHILNKNNQKNNLICIFGVLVNDKGLEIEKSMLEWLLPEYNVYCVYQKYPGNLYEYPALRFAQWFSKMYNISIILYVHTKGSFYQHNFQNDIISLWKHEFTNPRNNIYIELLKKNLSDVTLPFRSGICTWYNGMFISNRAFNSIDTIAYRKNDRFFYESLFRTSEVKKINIRIKGILNDTIKLSEDVLFQNQKYLYYFNAVKINEKKKIINTIIIKSLLLLFIILIKYLLIID